MYPCSSVFISHAAGAASEATCKVCPFADWTCENKADHPTCKALAEAASRAELPLPPTGTQIGGFLASVVRHLVTGLPQATGEVLQARLALCKACDKFRHSDGRCSMCGCHVSIKARWQGERCPDGKW